MRSVVTATLACVVALVAARAESVQGPAAPLSEAQLQERLRFYRSVSALEVSFKQRKRMKGLALELHSEGTLKVTLPDLIVWEIKKPSPLRVTIGAREGRREITLTSGRGESEQTQVFKPEEAGNDKAVRSLDGLSAWLKLDVAAIARQYEVRPEPAPAEPNSFLFTPKDAQAVPFRNLVLTLGSGGSFKRLRIDELSGDVLEINFGKPKLTRDKK